MRTIDTHTHIFTKEFDDDREEVISKAKEAGVGKLLLPNIDIESIPALHKLATKHGNYCLPMMGLHPTSVDQNWRSNIEIIKEIFTKDQYIAIGEIGLDLYWSREFENEQRAAFTEQLQWALDVNLPVSIHSRNAEKEAIEIVEPFNKKGLRGVLHSFGGKVELLYEALKLNNFMIGVNGVVTFKNSGLSDILIHTDLSRIVLETDAPYLTPVPHRGKRNEPAYIPLIVNKLAEIYNTTPSEVARITTENAERIFCI